jgi:Sap, sulfolipid-1-addressing protein
MGQAIGDVIPFAVGIAISPLSIIAVILMLFSPRARANGLSFLVGWVIGLAVVSGIVYAIADAGDVATDKTASDTSYWIKLGLGAFLVLHALRAWRRRPASGAEAETPKWMAAIDSFTPAKAGGFGVLLVALNPKNLALALAAGGGVAQVGASTGEAVVALAVFVVLASLGIAVPVVLYLFGGDRAAAQLDGWKAWLSANNAGVMAVLFLVFGAVLVGQGIKGLT